MLCSLKCQELKCHPKGIVDLEKTLMKKKCQTREFDHLFFELRRDIRTLLDLVIEFAISCPGLIRNLLEQINQLFHLLPQGS